MERARGASPSRGFLEGLRSRPRLEKLALLIWAVFAVLPSVLSAIRPRRGGDPMKLVSSVLGPEVGSYIGYAPAPLVAYVLSALVFTPLVALLVCMSQRLEPRRPVTLFARTFAVWWLLNGLSIAVVAVLTSWQRMEGAAEVWGWTWRMAVALTVSGLAPAAMATAVASSVWSLRRAVAFGAVLAAVIGLLGLTQRPEDVPVTPGAIDRALLSGRAGVPWGAVLSAGGWVCLGVFVAGAARAMRGKVRDVALPERPQRPRRRRRGPRA